MKHRVGILSLSDGRGRVHESLLPVIERYNDELTTILEDTGEVEVIRGSAPIACPEDTRREAARLVQAGVVTTVFHQPTFAFPTRLQLGHRHWTHHLSPEGNTCTLLLRHLTDSRLQRRCFA